MSASLKQMMALPALLALAYIAIQPAFAQLQFKNQSNLGSELKLPVHQWSNPDMPVKGIVVAIQAMVFNGKAFAQFAGHLNEKGYTVYAQDFRGYGDWLTDKGEFGGDQAIHFSQSKDDLTKILTALRQKFPGQKIFCIGESLGANLAIWEASTDPQLLDGAIACGLSNKHCRLRPSPHWAITIVKGLNDPSRPIDLKPYLHVLTEDKAATDAMVNDEQTTTAISPTDLIKANITNKNALKEIGKIPASMPILVIAGADDKVQQTKTLADIVKRMGSEQKELVVLPNKGHLLLEHRPVDPAIAQLIDNWLEKHQSNASTVSAVNAADQTTGFLH